MAWVTDAEFKRWVRLSIDDVLDDADVAVALSAAHRAVEQHCGRTFNTLVGAAAAATARVFAPTLHDVVVVDDFWTTDGLTVETRETSDDAWVAWPSSMWQLEPLNGVRYGTPGWPYERIRVLDTGEHWPWDGDAATVRVTAKWGWQSCPDDVRMATLIQASRLLKRREAPAGLLEFSGDGTSVRVSPLDGDVQRLLKPYVRLERQFLVI
jgi:hypothetical protein